MCAVTFLSVMLCCFVARGGYPTTAKQSAFLHKEPVYHLPLVGALEKSIFMREMFRGSFQLFFRGSNGQGVVSALFSGVKRSGSRLSPYLRRETARVSSEPLFKG